MEVYRPGGMEVGALCIVGCPGAEGECGCVPVSICGSALLCVDWHWFLLVALSCVYWSECVVNCLAYPMSHVKCELRDLCDRRGLVWCD